MPKEDFEVLPDSLWRQQALHMMKNERRTNIQQYEKAMTRSLGSCHLMSKSFWLYRTASSLRCP
jgi:hypothetical protein